MNALGERAESPAHRWCLWVVIASALLVRVFFASYGLHYGRFEDEQYSLRNIRSIVWGKTLRPGSTYYPYPLFNLPPAGLVAASDLLYKATGNESLKAWSDRRTMAPATYFLCRLVQCFMGALAVWLLYLLGREIRGPTTGLLAAAILSWVPWHIHASAYFKPDAQLVAMIVLALWLSLKALRIGHMGTYAVTGLAIAMAMSSKLTGGLVALPLVLGVVRAVVVRDASDPSDRSRPIRGLVLAGATSAATFVLMNPYWRSYPAWLGNLGRDYAKRAEWKEMTRLELPGRVVDFVRDPFTLGGVLGTVALVGFGLWLTGLFVRRLRLGMRADAALVLATFPLLYTLVYAIKTPYFKSNNFLPVVPVLVLALAWLLALGVERARSFGRGRFLGAFVSLAAVAPMVWSGSAYSYRSVTPTTMDKAKRFLNDGPKSLGGRVVLTEAEAPKPPPWYGTQSFGGDKSARVAVESLAELGHQRASRADGEIFPARRLESAQGEFYARRVARVGEGQAQRFGPRFLRTRGPELVVIKHFRSADGETWPSLLRPCASASCGVATVPSEAIGRLVSLRLWARHEPAQQVERAWLTIDDRVWPLHLTARHLRADEFISERFELSEGSRVELHWESAEINEPQGFRVVFHLWQARSGSRPPASEVP